MAEESTNNRALVINLDEIVPRTIVFELHGEQWIVPGDIDVETTFRIQRLLLDLADAESTVLAEQLEILKAEDEKKAAEHRKRHRDAFDYQTRTTIEMEKEILGLFRVHQPELEKLPFGAAGFTGVLGHILVQLGFGAGEEDEQTPDPTTTTPPPKMDVPKSRRSSGSSGSRKSSSSTRTSGSKAGG